MNKIIIYSSKYGSAKKYALELSKMTKINHKSVNEVDDVKSYDFIIYVAPLYAGNLRSFSKFINSFDLSKISKLIIVSVGLTSPNDIEAYKGINKAISDKLPNYLLDKYEIFNLQGDIDYNKLIFIHKLMVKMLYSNLKKSGKKESEIVQLMENKEKKLNLINYNSLNEIKKILH
ncbi:MAG: flavodoxin domain-containing protein [Pleomorphochaeta sp.]